MALWTPADLSSGQKIGWFDAEDAASITQSSGNVTAWGNKFGTSAMADLTLPGGATSPVYSSTSFNSSYGGITFGGAAGTRLDSTLTGFSGTNFTSVYIYKYNGGDTNDGRLLSLRDGSGGGQDFNTGGALISINGSGDFLWFADGNNMGNPVSAGTVEAVAAIKYDSGASDFRKNGLSVDTDASTLSTLGDADTLRVGASGHDVTEIVKAVLAEIVYLKDATQSDIEKIEGYAMWRRSLNTTLDSGHPYFSAAPTTGSDELMSQIWI